MSFQIFKLDKRKNQGCKLEYKSSRKRDIISTFNFTLEVLQNWGRFGQNRKF